jgi:hypothetical protein
MTQHEHGSMRANDLLRKDWTSWIQRAREVGPFVLPSFVCPTERLVTPITNLDTHSSCLIKLPRRQLSALEPVQSQLQAIMSQQ